MEEDKRIANFSSKLWEPELDVFMQRKLIWHLWTRKGKTMEVFLLVNFFIFFIVVKNAKKN